MHLQPKTLLFAEGLASVSLQFLFLRQTMAYAGSSVVVTSIVVSIFLLSLALGYQQGGRVTLDPLGILGANFVRAAALLAVGLSPVITDLFFASARGAVHPNVALALYCMIFMAPAGYWLAQTMPLLSNGMNARSNGELSGNVLFFNTLGNVVGGLASTLILMRFAGLAWTAWVNIIILIALRLAVSGSGSGDFLKMGTLAAGALLLTVGTERAFHEKTTAYGSYAINESAASAAGPKVSTFISNGLTQSVLGPDLSAAPYVEEIRRRLGMLSHARPLSILALGSGGFTLSARDERNAYTYVDIDEAVRPLAESRFLKRPIRGKFVAQDARSFLLESKDVFDVVILDAFSSTFIIPPHLSSQEFFALAASRLAPGGVFMLNSIQTREFGDHYARRLHATLTSVFPYCVAIDNFPHWDAPPGDTSERPQVNVLYTCQASRQREEPFIDAKVSY